MMRMKMMMMMVVIILKTVVVVVLCCHTTQRFCSSTFSLCLMMTMLVELSWIYKHRLTNSPILFQTFSFSYFLAPKLFTEGDG